MPDNQDWSGAHDRRKTENKEEREKFGKHLAVARRAIELDRKEREKKDLEERGKRKSLLNW